MIFLDREEVAQGLTYDLAIEVVRQAMMDFSAGVTRQHLRSILPLGGDRAFGIMPGALGEGRAFGAKLISVYPENFARGFSPTRALSCCSIRTPARLSAWPMPAR